MLVLSSLPRDESQKIVNQPRTRRRSARRRRGRRRPIMALLVFASMDALLATSSFILRRCGGGSTRNACLAFLPHRHWQYHTTQGRALVSTTAAPGMSIRERGQNAQPLSITTRKRRRCGNREQQLHSQPLASPFRINNTVRFASSNRLSNDPNNHEDTTRKEASSSSMDDYTHRTVLEALQTAVQTFNDEDVPDPIPSAVQLLALSLHLPWDTGYRDLMQIWERQPQSQQLLALQHRRLSATEAATLSQLMRRRRQHEPLQYIAGQWDFLDYTLFVRAPLLCPRPETEELVQLVIKDMSKQQQQQQIDDDANDSNNNDGVTRILDVGCGTGCIGIALADQIPRSHVTAIDVEPIAVETANANAHRVLSLGPHNNDDKFNNWSDRYTAQRISCADFAVEASQPLFDLVVSNPPYIPAADMNDLERTVVEYESPTALCAGGSADGMDVIRTIVRQLPEWCRPGAVCWMEVDPTHPEKLREWLGCSETDVGSSSTLGVAFVGSYKDMFGRDRFVKLLVKEI